MIDSVSSSIPVAANLNGANGAADRDDSDNAFVQLLEAICGLPGAGLQATLSGLAQQLRPGSSLSAELLSLDLDEGRGTGVVTATTPEKNEQENGPVALEVLMALLSTAASHLQPGHVETAAEPSPKTDGGTADVGWQGVEMGRLAGQLLPLAPRGSWALLEQALAPEALHLASGAELTSLREESQPGEQPGGVAPKTAVVDLMKLTGTQGDRGPALSEMAQLLGPIAREGRVTSSTSLPRDPKDAGFPGQIVVGDGSKQAIATQGPAARDPVATSSSVQVTPAMVGPAPESLHDAPASGKIKGPGGPMPADVSPDEIVPSTAPASQATLSLTHLAGSQVGVAGKTGHSSEGRPNTSKDLAASIVDQISRRANLLMGKGRAGLTIQLEPAELGKVRVHVSFSSEGLQVKLAAETNNTRDVIQASLPQLKAAFESQGLSVDKFDLAVGPGFSGFNSSADSAPRQEPRSSPLATVFPWIEEADIETSEIPEVRARSSLVDYRI